MSKFIVYRRATVDGVEVAALVKPDLPAGHLCLVSHEHVAWRDSRTNWQVLFPVEGQGGLGSNGRPQARCLFNHVSLP